MAKSCFKQNYCHACHTRFAVFFPLPSRCVSSLLRKLIFSGFKSRESGIGVQGNLHQCCDSSYRGMERISAEDDEEFFYFIDDNEISRKTNDT